MNTKENSMVYIAGRYSGHSYIEIDYHILLAKEAAAKLADAEVDYFCPHTHAAHFEAAAPKASYEFWLNLDMKFLKKMCNAALFLPGWELSSGARKEMEWCKANGILIFYSASDAITWWDSLPATVYERGHE